MPLGTPISFMVYGDPDGNGLPNDLVWLAQVDTTVPAFNPPPGSVNSLMTVNFTAPVQVGLSFFIAALILDAPQVPCLPEDAPQTVCWTDIRAEITAPHGRSWIALNEAIPLLGSLNPMNPGGAELPPTNIDSLIAPAHLDWILTATADPGSATPEPSTAALVLGGLAVAGFIRRRARR